MTMTMVVIQGKGNREPSSETTMQGRKHCKGEEGIRIISTKNEGISGLHKGERLESNIRKEWRGSTRVKGKMRRRRNKVKYQEGMERIKFNESVRLSVKEQSGLVVYMYNTMTSSPTLVGSRRPDAEEIEKVGLRLLIVCNKPCQHTSTMI